MMRHEGGPYEDEEGLEYVVPGADEEEGGVSPVEDEGGRLWGTTEEEGAE